MSKQTKTFSKQTQSIVDIYFRLPKTNKFLSRSGITKDQFAEFIDYTWPEDDQYSKGDKHWLIYEYEWSFHRNDPQFRSYLDSEMTRRLNDYISAKVLSAMGQEDL